ncbi:MAG: polysaccharide biosynthesis/export family protein [Muribaculaceae bacterium]|nr:polysaccharide biosynthesis/export family protein [Muribaculaceae bacterium]
MKFGKFLIMATVALLFVGCKSAKEVPYMQNIDQIPAESLASVSSQAGDFTMRVGDMLHITVSGSNADAVKPFNKVRYITDISGSNVSVSMGDASTMFYLIDKNGNIDFPVLGKLHVQGMTKSQVEEYIASLIYPRYLTEMPNVEVRIQNSACTASVTSTPPVSSGQKTAA